MENYIDKIPTLKIKIQKHDDFNLESIEGKIELSSWGNFQSRQGAYGGKSETVESEEFGLYVSTESEVNIVSGYQYKAYQYLIENEDLIKRSILKRLLVEYPTMQSDYGYEDDEKDQFMPDISSVEEFSKLMGLSFVHLIDEEKDGTGYVGFEFGCEWDPEHGIGVMTYKDEVVEIGGADTAFLTWIASRHKNPEKVNAAIEANYQQAEEHGKEQNKKP